MKMPVVAIGGPTASGKTHLGQLLAQKFNGQVVSIDSRQIYQGLDIGTAKDKTFPQLMIDIAPPGVEFSVTEFVARAVKEISILHRQNVLPILVGGTGYYLDALLYTIDFPNVKNPILVESLNQKTTASLEGQLKDLDPDSAIRTQGNRRRIIRALEIVLSSGKKVPKLKRQARYNHLLIIIDPGVEKLNQLIDFRIEKRLNEGLVEEVETLRTSVDHQWLMDLGLEYKYLSYYLDRKISLAEAKDQLSKATKAYAKRQRTWFKRYENTYWVKTPEEALELADVFLKKNNWL